MLKKLAKELEEELIFIRRELHKIPEIGTKEFKTSAFIKSKLDEYGISYKSCYNTGIIAEINPDKTNKCILLRADIDALPQTELTNLEFASEHEGIMHACGHDFHITCLLGAGKILKKIADSINGKVVLLFQPDEEFDGGALPMIKEGALNNVNSAVALHIEPLAKTGTIQIKDGSIMASPDNFIIKIIGKSGHGACPENCINPISAASEIVREYHSISIENCVVTVCTINGGTDSPNIIPDFVTITGTARTITPETRDYIEERLAEIAQNICNDFGAELDFSYIRSYPPLINNADMNKLVISAAEKSGYKIEILEKCSMTGEDFAYFAQNVPSSFFKLGTGDEKLGMYPLHNSRINPDEKALCIGAEILAQVAVDFINN